ncbi:hypothetical protein EC991_009216, partial [Linnemannia zychae]
MADRVSLMRRQCLEDEPPHNYIPALGKPSLDAPDFSAAPLLSTAMGFVDGMRLVMLLIGESGSGKTSFLKYLERHLWEKYEGINSPIPIYASLSTIDQPESNLLKKVLKSRGFDSEQISTLKDNNRQFILLCDGYDEARSQDNLYDKNEFGSRGRGHVKMIIACRSSVLAKDSDVRFQPTSNSHYDHGTLNLFQKVAMAPFTRAMIRDYVKKYADHQLENSPDIPHVWSAQEYMEVLSDIPCMMELVENPYILFSVLEQLPIIAGSIQAISMSGISPDVVYKHIFDNWMEVGKRRLQSKRKSKEENAMFLALLDCDFEVAFMEYLKFLTSDIFKEQGGDHVVQYSYLRDKNDPKSQWKEKYFGPDPRSTLLRESVPLIRSGNTYAFMHPLISQYVYHLVLLDPNRSYDGNTGQGEPSTKKSCTDPYVSDYSRVDAHDNPSIPDATASLDREQPTQRAQTTGGIQGDGGERALKSDHRLALTTITKHAFVILLLAYRVRNSPDFKELLEETVRQSRNNPSTDQTLAANAMTILVRSGMRFNSADLQGIKIRGANLTGGEFDSADLRNADLRNTILDKCCLRGARLEGAKLDGAEFGVLPYVDLSTIESISPESASEVSAMSDSSNKPPNTSLNSSSVMPTASAYTSDGKHYAVGFTNGFITIFDAFKWTIAHSFQGSKKSITAIAFSPKQERLAYGDMVGNIGIRENTGNFTADTLFFQAHGDYISDLVFSSDGRRIATSSQDNKLDLWDVQSGSRVWSKDKNRRHIGASSVAFSPDDTLLVSSGSDNVIKLWDVASGKRKSEFKGHDGPISKVLFSPKGHQLASASSDKTVRVWSVSTGTCENIFLGHSERVTSIAYSFDGLYLISSSEDNTIRTWDPRSGGAGPVHKGHKGCVVSIAYSPDGKQIVSCGRDKTLRVWICRTTVKGAVIFGRINTESSGWYPYSTIKWRGNKNNKKTFQPILHNPRLLSQIARFQGKGRVTVSSSGLLTATLSADSLSIQLYIRGASEPGAPLTGHSRKVTCFVFSPDSRYIASGSLDNTIRVWDTQSGNAICTLKGHTSAVTSVAYSSKGDRIVSSSKDSTVRLWDSSIQQASDIDAAVGEASTVDVAVGGTLARGAAISRCLLTFRCEGKSWPMQTVAISSCGHWVAAGGEDPVVRLWDAVNYTGKPHATFTGFDSACNYIVFSPDSIHLASASDDGTVWIWDIRTGEKKHTFMHGGSSVKCLAYLSSGKFLASGGKSCKIWDVEKRELEAELTQKHRVVSIASSSDSRKLWLGTENQAVHVWSYATDGQDTALVTTTAFSGDFRYVASSLGRESVHLWRTESGKRGPVLKGHSGKIECLSFSPINNLLITGCSDGTVGIWNSETGKSLSMLKGHASVVTGVVFSPNGNQFATVSMDETFRLWNAVGQEEGVSDVWQGFSMSDEEQHMLPPGSDGTTDEQGGPQNVNEQGFEAQMDQQESTMPVGENVDMHGSLLNRPELVPFYHDPSGLEHTPVYSPDGRDIAVINSQGTVLRFDTRTGESLPSLINGKEHSKTTCIAYIPDGSMIATSSSDGMARIWDPETGNVIFPLEGHTANVTSVTFSPFGHQVATSSADGTVQLWDIVDTDAHGPMCSPLLGHEGPVLCVAYSPDGKFLASGSDDRTLRLWDAFTRSELAVVGDFAAGVKTIQWKRTRGRHLLVTGCRENLPQVWEIVEGTMDRKVELRMYWGAGVDALVLSGARIGKDHG